MYNEEYNDSHDEAKVWVVMIDDLSHTLGVTEDQRAERGSKDSVKAFWSDSWNRQSK